MDMKKASEQKKYGGDEVKRFVGEVKEHFDHRFGLMYELLQGHIESNDEQFKSIDKNIHDIKKDIKDIKQELNNKVSHDEFTKFKKKYIHAK